LAPVVNFDQTSLSAAPQISACISVVLWEEVTVAPNNDKHKEYARYAVHCLDIVPAITDREYPTVQPRDGGTGAKLNGGDPRLPREGRLGRVE
jgi:hypothetical protein